MSPLSRLITVAFLLFRGAFAQAQFQDDFDRGNDSGWIRYDPLALAGAPATFSFPNGGYRIQAGPSPDPVLLGGGRAGSFRTDQVYPNFFLSADLNGWDNSANQSFGLMGRVSGLGQGAIRGYAFTYSSLGAIDLFLIANDRPTTLASKS